MNSVLYMSACVRDSNCNLPFSIVVFLNKTVFVRLCSGTCRNVAVFASVVPHDPAGMGSCTGYPSVLQSVLCFLRPTAVWRRGNKYKYFMSMTHC